MTLDFITLGETMIRLTPPGSQRLEQAIQVDLFVGGTESNVAICMARLGKASGWFSRLPDNPLGRQVANVIRSYGADVSSVIWAPGERLGLYFIEYGAPPRPTRVWYDRANSAASRMTPNDLPREQIAAARWLHLTGITPALSETCAETVQAAMRHAHAHGRTVSFDVNYRALLWSPATAARALEPYCQEADIVMVAARDAQNLFGTGPAAEIAARDLQGRWGGTVIVTDGANGACGYDGQSLARSDAIPVTLVDRLGAGDAFDAGVICRLLEGAPLNEALQFGAAAAAIKLTIPGDIALLSRHEVEELIAQGGTALHR